MPEAKGTDSPTEPTKSSEAASLDLDSKFPPNYQNRIGRWTNLEISQLKIAMSIFGDQSWKKIQRYLVQESRALSQSKQISKKQPSQFTYRSIKAIQSKIYQIKSEIEDETT